MHFVKWVVPPLEEEQPILQTQIAGDLFHAREARGWTQPDVVKRIGISLKICRNIEAGAVLPRADNLPKRILLFDLNIENCHELLGLPKRE